MQYLYNEISDEKRKEIDAALATDFELREKLNVMSQASKRLDALSFAPRKKTIEHIMEYAGKSLEELSH